MEIRFIIKFSLKLPLIVWTVREMELQQDKN